MTPADVLAAAAARSRFAAEVMRGEGGIELARAALLVGAEDDPGGCDVEGSLELLEAYGAEARSRVARAAGRELAALNDYLFGELGFAGNREDYYDPANSLLHRVLERRKGIPITLSIVYMEVGRRAGLKVEGVGLPGHFIVRAMVGDSATLVDPFEGKPTDEDECRQRLDSIYGGQLSLAEEHLRPASARAILARLLGNLKAVYVQSQLYRRALAAVERMLLLAPHSLEERRDRGLILAQLDRLHEAVLEIQSYLNLAPEAQDASTVREQLNKLRMRLAMLN
jgi:regulator of sirC expression with transglutaminase-like and TPR domain